jgi:hypothetical protein
MPACLNVSLIFGVAAQRNGSRCNLKWARALTHFSSGAEIERSGEENRIVQTLRSGLKGNVWTRAAEIQPLFDCRWRSRAALICRKVVMQFGVIGPHGATCGPHEIAVNGERANGVNRNPLAVEFARSRPAAFAALTTSKGVQDTENIHRWKSEVAKPDVTSKN